MFSLLQAFLIICVASLSQGKITPDWPSIDARPLPQWFDEAKIGIFMHFGVYSVPGQGEWFWINWYNHSPLEEDFMKKNYPPNFGYQNFAPLLTMEFFNATLIADMVASSGAKYLVFTSKHHEGFTNWPSPYTFGWNSVDVGPNRNVLAELKDALLKRDPDIKFGLYYSLFEWFNPLYVEDKASGFKTRDFVVKKVIPELKELVEVFQPYILWADGDWEASSDYWGSTEFLAWLYNESASKDFIVTNDRWGTGTMKTHGGFWSGPDRWSPGVLIPHKWENALTIDKKSWGIRRNIQLEDVLDITELLSLLASTISCGGNFLVNVGPTKEGTIIPIFQERLHQMGQWLKQNGESVYKTSPWTHQNDSQAGNVWYTEGKEGQVYAMVIGWPKESILRLKSVSSSNNSSINLIGRTSQDSLPFKQTQEGLLEIQFPALVQFNEECPSLGCQWIYVLKMTNVTSSNIIY